MKIRWKEKFQALAHTYAAIAFGLAACLAMGAAHWNTANFWFTALIAFLVVTFFEVFVLAIVDEDQITPSKFLFRMMVLVVTMQIAFAFVYYFAANDQAYLIKNGQPISDFVDAVYFSGITLLTVGYGDITPVGDFRFTAVAEVYGGTLFIFAFFTWGLSMIASRHLEKRLRKRLD